MVQCEKVEIPSEAGTRAGCRTQKVNIKNKEKGTGKRKNMKTRKLFSRIMAAVVAMILVLGMNMTALASTLTVTGTKDKGGDVTAYKLFDRTEQPLEGGKKAVAYTLSSKYAGYFSEKVDSCKDKNGDALSEAAYNYVAGLADDTKKVELSQFAADMWKWISENGKEADGTATAADTATTMTLGAGYYLIFPAGAATLTGAAKSPAILQDVDGTNPVNVTLKSEYPTLEKKVATTPAGTPALAGTVKPGDTVTYTITSKVPDVSGYTKGYKFVIKDTLSDGLTFNEGTVSVKIGANDLVAPNYELKTGTDAAPNTFTLELKNMTTEEGGKQVPNTAIYPTGETITLTYTATVNEKAVTGIDPNTNKAKVEYSNKPGEDGTGESEEVEAKVYTFEFGIFKYSLKDGTVDEASNRNPLANAQFKLYADEAHNKEIKLVEETGKVYRQAKDDTETAVDYIETDTTGRVTIKGLKEGTYYLAETKAPAGFNKLVGDIKVEIGNPVYDTTDTTKLNSYDVTYTMPGETSSSIKVTVPTDANLAEIPVLNKAGSVLPSTGGMGTVVFTIAGAAIIGLMLVSSLVSKKRKRSE